MFRGKYKQYNIKQEDHRVRFIVHTCQGRIEIASLRPWQFYFVQSMLRYWTVGRPDLHHVTCGAWTGNGTEWEINVAHNAYASQTVLFFCVFSLFILKLARYQTTENVFIDETFSTQNISHQILKLKIAIYKNMKSAEMFV